MTRARSYDNGIPVDASPSPVAPSVVSAESSSISTHLLAEDSMSRSGTRRRSRRPSLSVSDRAGVNESEINQKPKSSSMCAEHSQNSNSSGDASTEAKPKSASMHTGQSQQSNSSGDMSTETTEAAASDRVDSTDGNYMGRARSRRPSSTLSDHFILKPSTKPPPGGPNLGKHKTTFVSVTIEKRHNRARTALSPYHDDSATDAGSQKASEHTIASESIPGINFYGDTNTLARANSQELRMLTDRTKSPTLSVKSNATDESTESSLSDSDEGSNLEEDEDTASSRPLGLRGRGRPRGTKRGAARQLRGTYRTGTTQAGNPTKPVSTPISVTPERNGSAAPRATRANVVLPPGYIEGVKSTRLPKARSDSLSAKDSPAPEDSAFGADPILGGSSNEKKSSSVMKGKAKEASRSYLTEPERTISKRRKVDEVELALAKQRAAERAEKVDVVLAQLDAEAERLRKGTHSLIQVTYKRLAQEKEELLKRLENRFKEETRAFDRLLEANSRIAWHKWAFAKESLRIDTYLENHGKMKRLMADEKVFPFIHDHPLFANTQGLPPVPYYRAPISTKDDTFTPRLSFKVGEYLEPPAENHALAGTVWGCSTAEVHADMAILRQSDDDLQLSQTAYDSSIPYYEYRPRSPFSNEPKVMHAGSNPPSNATQVQMSHPERPAQFATESKPQVPYYPSTAFYGTDIPPVRSLKPEPIDSHPRADQDSAITLTTARQPSYEPNRTATAARPASSTKFHLQNSMPGSSTIGSSARSASSSASVPLSSAIASEFRDPFAGGPSAATLKGKSTASSLSSSGTTHGNLRSKSGEWKSKMWPERKKELMPQETRISSITSKTTIPTPSTTVSEKRFGSFDDLWSRQTALMNGSVPPVRQ